MRRIKDVGKETQEYAETKIIYTAQKWHEVVTRKQKEVKYYFKNKAKLKLL